MGDGDNPVHRRSCAARRPVFIRSGRPHDRWMRADERVSWAFMAVAGLHVAGLFLDRRLLPYAATVAILMLMALGLLRSPESGRHRWSRRLALAGLASVAMVTGLVNARTGGFGWPAWSTAGRGGRALVEATLLAGAGSALGAAVLCRVRRLLRLWHLPAVLASAGYPCWPCR